MLETNLFSIITSVAEEKGLKILSYDVMVLAPPDMGWVSTLKLDEGYSPESLFIFTQMLSSLSIDYASMMAIVKCERVDGSKITLKFAPIGKLKGVIGVEEHPESPVHPEPPEPQEYAWLEDQEYDYRDDPEGLYELSQWGY